MHNLFLLSCFRQILLEGEKGFTKSYQIICYWGKEDIKNFINSSYVIYGHARAFTKLKSRSMRLCVKSKVNISLFLWLSKLMSLTEILWQRWLKKENKKILKILKTFCCCNSSGLITADNFIFQKREKAQLKLIL